MTSLQATVGVYNSGHRGLGKSGSSRDGKEQTASKRILTIDMLLKIMGEIQLPKKQKKQKKSRARTKTGEINIKRTRYRKRTWKQDYEVGGNLGECGVLKQCFKEGMVK